MLFSSMTFLFLFLPLVLAAYYVVNPKWRNLVLLFASIFFYAWGEPRYVLILFLTIICNYLGALLIDKYRSKSKLYLFLTICCDLGILIYFKYTNFIIENINMLFRSNVDFIKVIMPIGISFYTFQAISYLVDVYRKDCPVQKNFYDLMLYIVLFPQMIAGPIVKYHDVANQISDRTVSADDFIYGVKRFITGLGKKVLIANTMGEIVEQIFNTQPHELSTVTLWLGAIAYTFQLYYDFSGYSDMAIGLGRMLGFRFLENFNYPYISSSITEFWRRWHISMSTWFKEYLYIPLGGNRVSKSRNYLNLWIVFLATGIWHGASWNFIFWGLWHGFFIVTERVFSFHKEKGSVIKQIIMHIYTIFVFVIGWVMFRADTMDYAWKYIKGMFMLEESRPFMPLANYCSNVQLFVLVIAAVCSMPIFRNLPEKRTGKYGEVTACFCNIWLLAVFVLSSVAIANSTFNPFIYFRF